jgi:hypothetical protein
VACLAEVRKTLHGLAQLSNISRSSDSTAPGAGAVGIAVGGVSSLRWRMSFVRTNRFVSLEMMEELA